MLLTEQFLMVIVVLKRKHKNMLKYTRYKNKTNPITITFIITTFEVCTYLNHIIFRCKQGFLAITSELNIYIQNRLILHALEGNAN